jgi:anti-sigma factor RsiW
MSCRSTSWLGAYALGALDPGESARVDGHLTRCPDCRAELAELRPVVAHLDCVPQDEAERLDAAPAPPPPPGVLLALRARARRRALRRRMAAAATLAVAGVLAAVALAGAGPAEPATVHAAATDPVTRVHAYVALTPQRWGTEVRVGVNGVAPGERCRLVVRGHHGQTEVAATWHATYRGRASVTGAAAIPLADVTGLDVVAESGRRLVHLQPKESIA